jgi:dCMP deaminase
MSDKWDSRFIDLARLVASWSKDPSTKVGAVIVRPDRTVASIGYNGFARGVRDHTERYANRETKYAMVVHAESNALLNSRESLEDCTLYVTPIPPCSQCAAAIIQRGIRRVVVDQRKEVAANWAQAYSVSETMFTEAGVAVCILSNTATRQANDNASATSDVRTN